MVSIAMKAENRTFNLPRTRYFLCSVVVLVISVVAIRGNNDENTFDSFLNSLDSAVDTLFEYMGDPEGCFFKCPGGEKPIPNPRHKPSSNGCGAAGMMLDTSMVPGVTKCCDKHDFCYDTCGKQKQKCDDDFEKCLMNICKSLKKVFRDDAIQQCKNTAGLMYGGVMALGCKPYRDAQKQACQCPSEKIKREL